MHWRIVGREGLRQELRIRSCDRNMVRPWGGRRFSRDFDQSTARGRCRGIAMSFLLFLRGLIGVLLAFAIVTYLMTQSLWTTFVHTVICGVLIQIGYFVAV